MTLHADRIQIPNPPSGSDAPGLYRLLRLGLADIAEPYRTPAQSPKAVLAAKRWATRPRLEAVISRTMAHPQFAPWEEWFIGTWIDHFARHGALFDVQYQAAIARYMNVSLTYVEKLWQRTSQLNYIESLIAQARRGHRTEELSEATTAWLVSSIIRGRAYDDVARGHRVQQLHHPFRQYSHRDQRRMPATLLVDHFDEYMSNILLASALSARQPEERVGIYSENVRRVRQARATGQLRRPTSPVDSSAALDAAVGEARRLNIRAHSRTLEVAIGATVATAIATATGFVGFFVSPVEAFALGVGSAPPTAYALGKTGLDRRLSASIATRERRMQELATFGPSRLEVEREKQ